MNEIFNPKTVQLQKNLAALNEELARATLLPNDSKIRELIDARRFCLAQLQSAGISLEQTRPNTSTNQITNPEIDDLIVEWCSQVKTTSKNQVTFEDETFCNQFIDYALPKIWHFDNDIVVVISPPSAKIVDVLKQRQQKNIVVFMEPNSPQTVLKSLGMTENTHLCESISDLERTFALLQAPAQKVIKISCSKEGLTTEDAISEAINAGKRTRFENTRTAARFGNSWATNVLKNLPIVGKAKNIHELSVKGVQDAVIVASGPSLNKNVDQLREIQDKVFIVTALRSLPVLQKAGVEPDLVIQLDAEDDEVAKQLSPDTQYQIKNFLFELIVNPGFLKIPAKQKIWSLAQHFFDVHEHFGTKPTPWSVPSVSIYALCLCRALRFKNIAFIGQDLAADGSRQYADGATSMLPAHAKMSMFHIEVPGFYGKSVMTRNSFEYQIKRCSELAQNWRQTQPDLNLVNATEGGAFIEGFDHMSLKSFSQSRKLYDISTDKKVEFNDYTPISDVDVRNYFRQALGTLDRMIDFASLVIKLDTQKEKTRGLQKKIQKTVKKFQALNDTTSLMLVAMQDRISQVIGTSEKGQNIGTFEQFFAQVKKVATELRIAIRDSQ